MPLCPYFVLLWPITNAINRSFKALEKIVVIMLKTRRFDRVLDSYRQLLAMMNEVGKRRLVEIQKINKRNKQNRNMTFGFGVVKSVWGRLNRGGWKVLIYCSERIRNKNYFNKLLLFLSAFVLLV